MMYRIQRILRNLIYLLGNTVAKTLSAIPAFQLFLQGLNDGFQPTAISHV
jgi:hypothetical protein